MSLILEDVVINTLKNEYNLSAINCQKINSIMIKHNYLIEDVKRNKWFVKYYPLAYGEDNLDKLGQIYGYLEQHGIPCNKIKKNEYTRKSYMRTSTGFYVVYSYIDGIVADRNSAINVVNHINKLHEIDDDLLKAMLDSTSDRIKFSKDIYTKIHEPHFLEFRCYLGNRVDLIGELLGKQVLDCNTIIHGDLNLGNILIRGNEIYFIDFDEIRVGDPMEDLVSLIYSMIYRNRRLDFQFVDNIRKLVTNFLYENISFENIEKLDYALKLNSLYYLMQRAEYFQYLKKHKSTLNFMNSLLEILDCNIIQKILYG